MAKPQPRVVQPLFEGFLVRSADGNAVRKRIAAVASGAAVVGTGWRTRELLPSLFHVIPPSGLDLAPKRAFAVARGLVGKGIDDAEAAFATTGLQPVDPDRELLPEERTTEPSRDKASPGKKGARKASTTADYEWALKNAGVKSAWTKFNVSGAGVVVAHPDTGYTFHDELDGPRLLWQQGYDYEGRDKDPQDELVGFFPKDNPGHGTATGSVIMSDRGPKSGRTAFVSGAAYDAKLVPLRVSTRVEHFSFVKLICALKDAKDAGLDVVSMSLGGPLQSDSLEVLVRDCVDAGMILIAAAGQVWPWVIYPARLPEVIGVAAVESNDKPWWLSASGPTVDISAPGVDVWVATAKKNRGGNKYDVEMSSGTSHATAITAGIACLWLEHHGGAAAVRANLGGRVGDVFRAALKKHARVPDGWKTDRHGAGIVDAASALDASIGGKLRVGARGHVDTGPSWLALLPGMTLDDIDAATALIHGKKAKQREPYDRELHFHLATNPALRRAFRAKADVTGKKAGKKSSTGLARSALTGISPDLAALLS